MFLRCPKIGGRWLVAGDWRWFVVLLLFFPLLTACPNKTQAKQVRKLRVCADPNNLPFSNERGEGFENKLAQLIARDWNAQVEYVWWAQRRGFLRHTLNAGRCDVVMGVPKKLEMVLTTAPYYRSSYVFVTRQERGLRLTALDDAALRRLKIGVQMIGDDGANAPPAHALAARGIITNVRGYTVYGDYAQANPPAKIIDAVVNGEIDVALVWGPLAGYFAKQQKVPLDLVPISPAHDSPLLPFVYDIALGVRRGDVDLQQALNQSLAQHRSEIEALLDEYGIPRSKE
jgi:mxaJ protein